MKDWLCLCESCCSESISNLKFSSWRLLGRGISSTEPCSRYLGDYLIFSRTVVSPENWVCCKNITNVRQIYRSNHFIIIAGRIYNYGIVIIYFFAGRNKKGRASWWLRRQQDGRRRPHLRLGPASGPHGHDARPQRSNGRAADEPGGPDGPQHDAELPGLGRVTSRAKLWWLWYAVGAGHLSELGRASSPPRSAAPVGQQLRRPPATTGVRILRWVWVFDFVSFFSSSGKSN